KALYNYAPI
nr:Chain C, 9-mer peptide from Dopamine beta-monooxygenase [Rattus norvegicus]1ZHB_F Chain F, 9-mer peptide from Dopamine beta-monooxygenase [Rattus norvegicus]1ZHB_I Chain I, 9-mer peptide from Dopamine beta-monooxygenase [Rattus norvegicus]1ZHB_L Chain L, 9-mer peptide from Dopamine beta-monooxygenase [Rattus norvegicus]